MHPHAGVAYFGLLFSLQANSWGVTGAVLDPQNLAVRGARVTLSCGALISHLRTDGRGEFMFKSTRSPVNDCEISVVHPGFETFHGTVGGTDRVQIHLTLPPLKEAVEVVADYAQVDALSRPTLTSISLSSEELGRISNNTVDLIRYAKLLAGVNATSEAIRVDGMPATQLPPAEMIARITVNGDPFSTEYADGDQTSVDITTKGSDRHFRFNLDGGSVGSGGSDTLRPGLRSAQQSQGFSLSGPVPHLPVTFSSHVNLGYTSREVPIQAIVPVSLSATANAPEKASATNRAQSASADAYYSGGGSRKARISYYRSRSASFNLGVGGLTLPEAGLDSFSIAKGARANLSGTFGDLIYRSAFAFSGSDSRASATSGRVGVSVLGAFVTGGAFSGSGEFGRTQWSWKNILQSDSQQRPWTVGVTISRTADLSRQTPNPAGSFTFENLQAYNDALAGNTTGTWLVARGNGNIQYAGTTIAPFWQATLLRSNEVLVRGGLRADYQSGLGTVLSPRLSAAARWKGFVLRTGGGLFVHSVPEIVFEKALAGDGLHLQQFMARGVALRDPSEFLPGRTATIRSQLACNFTQPREFMQRTSVERSFGKFTSGVEYTWTRAWHLMGSRRLADGTDWVDVIDSGRAAARHRLHFQAAYNARRQTVIAYYDWLHSRDDTDGPFSFFENQNGVRAEWARSTGASPRNVTLAYSFQLPAGLFLMLTDTWRGSAPYNIASGVDAANDGLYTDRGGRSRNSGNGPRFNSLQLYASRRMALPALRLPNGMRIHINVGIQGENLLGNKNYIGFGSVAGSPIFGVPLGTQPGRSVRFWFNFD